MTLDEAIEIKRRNLEGYTTDSPERIAEADRLSIEALKRYKVIRDNFGKLRQDQLPGETKD